MPGKPKSKLDKSKMLELKQVNGMSYAEIAALDGTTPQNIHSKIKDLLPTEETNTYQQHRADILAEVQRKLLSNIDAKRLSKASAYQLAGAAGLLYDKERLERGQTTTNIGALIAHIEGFQRSDFGCAAQQVGDKQG